MGMSECGKQIRSRRAHLITLMCVGMFELVCRCFSVAVSRFEVVLATLSPACCEVLQILCALVR